MYICMQVLSESLMWMAKAVDDFGSATLNVQLLIDWMKVSDASLLGGIICLCNCL